MRPRGGNPLYRHGGVALLRAAAMPLSHTADRWPDLADTEACRAWLRQVWNLSEFTGAVRQASPNLADRVDAVCAGRTVQAKQVRRAAAAVTRYLLRAIGRPTPFGLFAGVARVSLGSTSQVRWGDDHRALARVDTEWLADVVERLEASPDLLERLNVVFNDLTIKRGGRLQAPLGPNRVEIRHTSAVQEVWVASAAPIRFSVLADKLAETFPGTNRSTVLSMLATLVRQGFLITCLRAPSTVTDPLAHLVDRLQTAEADTLPSVLPLLRGLEAVRAGLHQHNHESGTGPEQERIRAVVTRLVRELSSAGRTALAVDLLLDCDVQLSNDIAHEMEQAADALLRLTRQPSGQAVWRDFHAVFCDRYGTGSLVPLADVVDPDSGVGYPAGYPDSTLPPPSLSPSERDERLLALAWQAVTEGNREITLTDEDIHALTGGERFDERCIPPHVELAARIHAPSLQALDHGEYTLTVAPARAAGTLTSRFTPAATGSGLEEVYRDLPAASEGALQAQLSFRPIYPHAENICRVPAYLPHVLPLGEHRDHDETTIAVNDLAITATRDRLHLISISRQQVIEPQVFHALALEKQPPPLARFLAHLPRAFTVGWYAFDWGPHAHRLPYLPQIRYRRTVISPARWRLTTDDLPSDEASQDDWQQALSRWRQRWHCPDTVELRDADRTLRLDLDAPTHTTLLRAHLKRHGDAVLTETAEATAFGWLDGHAHEIALPLTAVRTAAPSPLSGTLPQVTNSAHGHLPGSPASTWLYAKIHTHPERHDEIIAEHLPRLLASLDDNPAYWFVRYRSPHEPDHIRLRVHISEQERYAAYTAALGDWGLWLRHNGMAGRLTFDTYFPETGRYGHGAAMKAAEAVFAADSHAVSAGLHHLPATAIHPTALAAVNMVDIVHGFLEHLADAMDWLAARPAPATAPPHRAIADQVVDLARRGTLRHPGDWPSPVVDARQARAAALASYRKRLPSDADTDAILESLLHMHHNRALGIAPDGERTCRRLARQAALAWRVQQGGDSR